MKKIFSRISRMRISHIRTKLTSAFSLILIIPILIVGGLSYVTAKNTVQDEILAGIDENLNLVNSSINQVIEAKAKNVEYFAENAPTSFDEESTATDLLQRFEQYYKLNDEVTNIYIGTEDGAFLEQPITDLDPDYDARERDWYKESMAQKGQVVLSEPYLSAGLDEMVVTLSQTTADGKAVIGIDIDLAYLKKLINQIKVGEGGYAFLLDANKKYLAHPVNPEGSEASEEFFDKMYVKDRGELTYEFGGEQKIMKYITNDITGWKLGGNIVTAEISSHTASILKVTVIVMLLSVFIGSLAIYFIIQFIIKPLNRIKEKAITISQGDLTEPIDIKTNDEIGQLGRAFNEMQDSLRNLVQKIERSAKQVTDASEELSTNAVQTSTTTKQVTLAIQEVAGSAEKQTQKVDENALALEKVTEGVIRIAESSTKVYDLSHHAMRYAEDGGQAVQDTVAQMQSIYDSVTESNQVIKLLNERSKEVNSILSVITSIADQTNLLALNAAIEAARAGEHGKGFSVVAEEVRKLAEQSQQSAKEIYNIIERIQVDTGNSVAIMGRVMEDVQSGVNVSNDAIEKFNDIIQSTKEMTPQMDEVSMAAQQMAVAIQAATTISTELSAIAQENAATSEEVAASTEEQLAAMEEITTSSNTLSDMAEELNGLVAQFKW
nr:methyl-accepting chemotaxis protein [Bacillus tuaregi]